MPDVTARSDDLSRREAEAGGPDALIAGLRRGLRRQQRLTYWTIASVVADVLLSIALSIALAHLNTTANLANRNASLAAHNSTILARNTEIAYQFCLSTNDSRAAEKALWHQVLSVPPDPTLTPRQLKLHAQSVKDLRAFVDKRFAPRVCTKEGH